MNRRELLGRLLGLSTLGLTTTACPAEEEKLGTLKKPASEWKPLLSKESYGVLFNEDTERAGSSPLNHEKRKGTFVCAACYQPLFGSDTKFESGTGWPSFWKPLPNAVGTRSDRKFFMERTEYHCSRCGGHQGHVFDDGPKPTGLRYCNNGLALNFVPDGETLPALRG